MNEIKKSGHIAGAIYLSMVLAGPPTLMVIPGKLIVRGDAAATANNFLAHATLTRWWIVGDLSMAVIFICLGLALYHLLSRVSRIWALLMVAFVLVSATIAFVNALNAIAAVNLFRGGEFLSVIDKPQRDALGMLFVRLHSQSDFINEIFWGVWLFPFGLLVVRSGFLPRWIGIWLIIECFAWLILSPIALFWPDYYGMAFRYSTPIMFAEIAIMLWLLIKGAKISPANQPIARSV